VTPTGGEAREPVDRTGGTGAIGGRAWLLLWLIAPIVLAVRLNFDGPLWDWLIRKDFVNLWVAGRLAWAGALASIFDPTAFQQASSAMLGGRFATNNYSYPPHALFVAMPFALLPYGWSYLAWNGAGLAAFTWAARRACPAGFPWLLAGLTPAALINIVWGHYGFLYGALWLLAFEPRRSAGIAAALLTFKPHLGLLVAAAMASDRRRLGLAVAGTLLLVLASAAAFGWPAWRAFFVDTFRFQAGLIAPDKREQLMFLQVSPLISYGWLGWAYSATLAIWLAARCFNVFTAATATFLIVPYGFHYDMTVACLGFAVTLFAKPRMRLWERLACALGFLSPALVLYGNFLAAPILLVGLWVQTRQLDGRRLPSPATMRSAWRRRRAVP
jgi:hypothetical protein